MVSYPCTGWCTPGFRETLTLTRQNPYPGCGYGFAGVGVRVALEYPRVTCDNHYYRLIQGMKCKKSSCDGVPILRALKEVFILLAIICYYPTYLMYFLKQAPNVHGKNHFIGCTRWRKGEKFEHLYAKGCAESIKKT